MAQHDYDIANATGANFRADLNNALDAIVSNNSGSSEPSTKFAYEWWIDTSNNLLKLRNSANNAWITLPLSITADNATSGALTVNGNLTTTGTIDVNGQELILDADADTSITADTDDQIDFKIGNVDVATLTNSHLVMKGTTPKITIGDGGEEDTALIFDGNAQDFYIGLDDSADDLVIGTGSTVGTNPKVVIENGGNVGIGTAAPSRKLSLEDSGTTTAIELKNSTGQLSLINFSGNNLEVGNSHSSGYINFFTNNGNSNLFMTSDEKLGLGTSSPQGQLHIQKDSTETDLVIQSNTGGTGSAAGGRLRLQLGAQTNTGSGGDDTQAGDTLGQIMFEGQGTDYAYQGGNIICKVQTGDGDDGRSNQGTFMSFETINVGSASPAENFRIAQDGTLTATDTTIGSNSDRRIKKNITDFTGGLDLVKSLQPRTFEFKDETGKRKSGIRRGFVAQEILEKDDYWVYEQEANDKDDSEYEYTKDTEKVYVSKLTDKDAMYVSAIQELEARIKTLEG
jgi:hypothetical protein